MSNYKNKLYESIINKDLSSFRKRKVGNYLSTIMNDTTIIELDYLDNIFELPEQLFLLVCSLIAMVYTNFYFFIIILLSSSISVISTTIYGNKVKRREEKISEENGKFLATVKDLLSGFTVIKSFNTEKETLDLYISKNNSLEFHKLKKKYILGWIVTASESAGIFLFIVVFMVGSIFTVKGLMEIGTVVAFVQLINYLVDPIAKLPQIYNKINAAKSLIKKANGIISEDKIDECEKVALQSFEREITYKNVSFLYDNQRALHNINIEFEKGKSYAIVGVSGSGKSTLLKLLMGYYNTFTGSIKIDDVDISKLEGKSLCDIISIIEQEVFIFDDDIQANVTMHKEFEQSKIDYALKASGLEKLITEKGTDYKCGENGMRLSGGERQRIAIARCLLKNTQIILMDEAMSALDNKTAIQIEDEILKIKNLTKIIVTHKLSSKLLEKYDEIITLRDGVIVEKGSFAELMNKKGCFYSIYNISPDIKA